MGLRYITGGYRVDVLRITKAAVETQKEDDTSFRRRTMRLLYICWIHMRCLTNCTPHLLPLPVPANHWDLIICISQRTFRFSSRRSLFLRVRFSVNKRMQNGSIIRYVVLSLSLSTSLPASTFLHPLYVVEDNTGSSSLSFPFVSLPISPSETSLPFASFKFKRSERCPLHCTQFHFVLLPSKFMHVWICDSTKERNREKDRQRFFNPTTKKKAACHNAVCMGLLWA